MERLAAPAKGVILHLFSLESIDHVQLAAPPGCEEVARQFFVDLLGMEEIEKPAPLRSRGGAWFRSGGVQVHVGVQESFAPATKAHPAIRVSGLRELKAKLRESNIQVIDDEDLPGYQRFYAFDPFGNRLEFLEPEA